MYDRAFIIHSLTFFGVASGIVVMLNGWLEYSSSGTTALFAAWVTCTLVFTSFALCFNLKKSLALQGIIQEKYTWLQREVERMDFVKSGHGPENEPESFNPSPVMKKLERRIARKMEDDPGISLKKR